MKIKKILLVIIGVVGLVMGAVGAVVPLLPAFPFLLLAAVSFAKSSKRLENWFKGTKLYKKNLEPFLNGEGLTIKAKVKILLLITFLLAFGFYMVRGILVAQILIGAIWIFHILFFILKIKTLEEEK